MAEKRSWTQEEDRILKFVFESTKIAKWSHIARRLQTEYGVKGRNGKQCRERYTTHIDPSYPKQQWSHEQELKMFELHNELGNKWAIIGSKCCGKTDNSVKNHFYSRLRKSLKKINQVYADEFHKDYKEIKPPILYKIVEVTEERFKLHATFDKEFVCFSNQLKNQLLDFAYDQEDNQDIQESAVNVEVVKNLMEKFNEFAANYKKKNRKQRKSQGIQSNLLTPNRYDSKVKRCHSENEQSSQNNSFVNSSDVGNSEDISDDEINRNTLTVGFSNKLRRNSADNSLNTISVPRIRTRANSNEKITKESRKEEQSEMKDQRFQQNEKDIIEGLQVEGILQGLQILEQESNVPPHPLLMNKETSRYSRYSEGIIQKEQYHFFEDSQMEMRILPEVEMAFKRESHYDQSIFR